MAFSIDLSGLTMLENAVAALQAQQAASPSGFTGGQSFATTFKGGSPGAQPGSGLSAAGAQVPTMTIAQLIQRLQALLLVVQQLPQ